MTLDDTKRTFRNQLTFKRREKKQVCVRLSLLLFQVSILLWPKFIDFSFFTHFPPFVASKKIYFKEFLVLCVLSFKLKGLRTIFNSGNVKYINKQGPQNQDFAKTLVLLGKLNQFSWLASCREASWKSGPPILNPMICII